jgi:malonyl-CoA O-methyltransferase
MLIELSSNPSLDQLALNAVLARLSRAPEAPWLHTEVARRMAEKLPLIRYQPEKIIDWWSALGAGAKLLTQIYPQAQRVCVEPSAAWVERSRLQTQQPWWAGWMSRRSFAYVTEELGRLPPNADLIWANMMLHSVVNPLALFELWQRLLKVNGFVMFSCLGPGSLRELRALYNRLDWPTPTPSFVDMHDLGDMLLHAGFSDPVMDQEILTLRWSSPQALLKELRFLGGNVAKTRMPGLRTPRWRERLERELESLAAPDGMLSLSFEVAYGHAFKNAPRATVGQTTTVSLEDMRNQLRATQR